MFYQFKVNLDVPILRLNNLIINLQKFNSSKGKKYHRSLREKCPDTEFFLVHIFLDTGKYGPEKTPYLNTFRAVFTTDCNDS